jgi:hypothetical protein
MVAAAWVLMAFTSGVGCGTGVATGEQAVSKSRASRTTIWRMRPIIKEYLDIYFGFRGDAG